MSKQEPLTYEPPRAMRLGEQPSGAGACGTPGSGDDFCDATGSTAALVCTGPGNAASTTPPPPGAGTSGCQPLGNSAGSFCTPTGNGGAF